MKICVAGPGALGSYYGAKLIRAGATVWFLLRSDFDVVRRQGLTIQSVDGDFHVRPRCARTPQEVGPCDLVLIGLKTTANAEFGRLLPPLVGPHTMLLTLQNGLGNEEALAQLFPANQILGGLAFVCLNRVAPGRIHHTRYGRVVLGEFQRPPLPRTYALAELFARTGLLCEVTPDLEQAHWEKLVWNVPFNGLGVASAAANPRLIENPAEAHSLPAQLSPCLTTDQLLADPAWESLVRQLMSEVITSAHALALKVPDSAVDENIGRTRSMGPYKSSTVLDYELGRPLELDSLFAEPLRRARSAGCHVPRLEALTRLLELLDHRPDRADKQPTEPRR